MLKRYLFLLLLSTFSFLCCQTKIKNNRVPDWAKDAVWYQIFPERFSNGDKNNDPQPIDFIEGWPYFAPTNWQIHPWESDWYKLQPWEDNGNDFYWNSGVRRYGGDLKGVINKLDYLQDLGITAIYFNPVFESPSLHKYDATYYHHIDNNFGPNPKKDRMLWEKENHSDPSTWVWTSADSLFLELIKTAHQKNIKIIIDGVFNHVGSSFWAFKDVVKNQQNSKYTNWFTINSFDNSNTMENEFNYDGWFGVKDMPEIIENENGLIEEASNHIHEIVKRWMDPNSDGDPSDGIDGWRLDVADMVNHNFWIKFRSWVKEINPEAYITGEIWWDEWDINKMKNAEPWLRGNQFDAVMNYRFTRAVKNFISDNTLGITSKAFADSITNIKNDYNSENFYVLMNLLGSHDTERLASLIVNPDHWFDHNANPAHRDSFLVRKPNQQEVAKQKLMVALQMTMPGAPMIYYGDEAGMWGGDDPDCRKPMVWADKVYENETTHPYGHARSEDKVQFDSALFNWYKQLISIRNNSIELRRGRLNFIDTYDNDVLAYQREFNNHSIFIIINKSDEVKSTTLEEIKSVSFNMLANENIEIKDSTVKLNPYEIIIYK